MKTVQIDSCQPQAYNGPVDDALKIPLAQAAYLETPAKKLVASHAPSCRTQL